MPLLLGLCALGGRPAHADPVYTFTTVDDPNAQFYPATFANALNNSGTIVGSYSTSEFTSTGFVDVGGAFSDVTDTDPTTRNTFANGINDSGTIVGSYASFFGANGFVDHGGVFTKIAVPGAFDTYATGINNPGQIVGYALNGNGTTYSGFLDTNGSFTPINDPLAGSGYGQGTYAWSINTAGAVAGYYVNSSGTHGFLDRNGVFTTLDDPNANYGTYALGINNLGEIVGYYVDNLGVNGLAYHGFLYNGSFTTIDDPDAIAAGGTEIYGINDLGQIVGNYTCAACGDNYQGFFATPGIQSTPEPSAWSLILIGALVALVRRARPAAKLS
ncbi:MAG TPA: hypothetical protein VKV17_22720 [Bryobacteraceae bacterium]|nr:hypothetical protein [Bryobacteraceae bacterium]